jgi:glutaconate CoA-transferase subunit B
MPGGGPQLVITDKAVFDFNTPAREMRLVSLHPGAAREDALSNIAWPVRVADDLTVTTPPTDEELRCIRQELDPAGLYRQ